MQVIKVFLTVGTEPPSIIVNSILSATPLLQIAHESISISELAIKLLITCILIFFAALMAGAEVAFFSMASKDLSNLSKKYGKQADQILALLEQPRRLLATILIANSFINIAVVALTYSMLHPFHLPALIEFLVEIVAITFILVLFGEVMPKVYATQHNVKMAVFMAGPITTMNKLFYPLSQFLISFTTIIERRWMKKTANEMDAEEIAHAIDIALPENSSKQEVSILKGIAQFGNTSVKQIMKARPDIISLDYSLNFEEVKAQVKEHGYSRIPVFEDGDPDKVMGVFFSKDMMEYLDKGADFDWHSLIRKPFFVPENKKINDLLQEFQQKRMHQAMVVDEYGGTAGLVSLEDILEEIIGDIKDEFDEQEENLIQRTADNAYIMDGKVLLNDVCRALDLPTDAFDEVKGESDTLAGLLLELFGRFPRQNESIRHEQFEFTILQLQKMRIAKVKLFVHTDLA